MVHSFINTFLLNRLFVFNCSFIKFNYHLELLHWILISSFRYCLHLTSLWFLSVSFTTFAVFFAFCFLCNISWNSCWIYLFLIFIETRYVRDLKFQNFGLLDQFAINNRRRDESQLILQFILGHLLQVLSQYIECTATSR